MGSPIHQGHVVYIDNKNQPGDGKRRPAVVVSINAISRDARHVVVVPVTSTNRPGPFSVHLGRGDGGLENDSTAQCDQITSLDKSLIGTPLGKVIPKEKLQEILKKAGIAIGIIAP